MAADVLLVSLASTAGLRASDAAFAGALRAAGVRVATVTAREQRQVRTFALTDLVWARAARTAATRGIAEHEPRVVVYSTVGAALLWPRPGAIRLDALMAVNRPGRHGAWQRPVEARRLREAPLLIPTDAGSLEGAPSPHADAVVVPIAVQASGRPPRERDVTAITYAANPEKKGLDRVLDAWARARRPSEELVVCGTEPPGHDRYATRQGLADAPRLGVRWAGRLEPNAYRALLRRARVFVTAPRREDFGIAQLEALADGCALVTTEAPGPYAALPIARDLDARLVGDDLAGAIRTALDDPRPDYAARAEAALERFEPHAVARVVREELVPRLLP